MSSECSECERDLRGGHSEDCSRYIDLPVCPFCNHVLDEGDGYLYCKTHGEV